MRALIVVCLVVLCGCPAKRQFCIADGECPGGQRCQAGVCRAPTLGDAGPCAPVCASGEVCNDGRCVSMCSPPCAAPRECRASVCIEPCARQCEPGFACEGTACLPDRDRDGIADIHDNCPETGNADQLDRDLDRIGDACDPSPDRPDLALKAGGFVSVAAAASGNRQAVTGVAGIPWGRERTRPDAGLIASDLNRALRR